MMSLYTRRVLRTARGAKISWMLGLALEFLVFELDVTRPGAKLYDQVR